MIHWILPCSLLLSSLAMAETPIYDLNMDLSLNGKHVSSPKATVTLGETATILQDSTDKKGERIFIEVVPREKTAHSKSLVQMDFVIGTVAANGERKVLATPHILTLPGKKAEITEGPGADSKEEISLSVIATPKIL